LGKKFQSLASKGNTLAWIFQETVFRTLGLGLNALKSTHLHRHEQNKNLALSIKNEVIDLLQELYKKHNQEAKKATNIGKKCEKELKKLKEVLEKVLS